MSISIPEQDARFAQLALSLNFVTNDQLRRSVELYKKYAVQGGEVPSIPRILVGRGLLDRGLAEGILRHIYRGEALPEAQPPRPLSGVAMPQVPNASAPVPVPVPLPDAFEADEPLNLLGESGESDVMADAPGLAGLPEEDEREKLIKGLGATVLRGEIKGYSIQEVIGEGSMGIVYKAHQISMDRIVALKVLPAQKTKDQVFVEQFLTEARSAGRLNHPNLIRVHEVGRYQDTYYYSMEYVDGLTLGEMMDEFEGGRLDPKRAINIFIQIAAALDHGYRNEIIHREIRPDCIMVTEGDQAKLEGLGLTKDEERRFLQGENAYYVSPEQARGKKPDTRSDLYSLGCCLFHCLSGEPPFHGGKQQDVLSRRLVAEAPNLLDYNPEIPPALAEIASRMMARDVEDRYQTPAEVMDALKQVTLAVSSVAHGSVGTGRNANRPSGRLRRRPGAGGGRMPLSRRRRRFRR